MQSNEKNHCDLGDGNSSDVRSGETWVIAA